MPQEVSGGQSQWTQTGHQTAMYLVQLNQVADNARFSEGRELELVKSPVLPDAGDDYQFKYYTRICIAENTPDPEAAGGFVNYMLNDIGAAEDVGLATGIPPNPDVVAAVRELGDPVDLMILDMQARIDEQPQRPRPEPPAGGAEWQSLIETASSDIFDGGVAISEAVRVGVERLRASLENA